MVLPEDKVTIILMLLADMLNTIVREIAALASRNGDSESRRGAAIGNIVVLCVLCLAFVIVNIVLFSVSLWRSYDDLSGLAIFRRAIIVVVQTLGAIFYIFGDNIGYILQNYSEELGCGPRCKVNTRAVAVFTLGLALVILQLFPVAFKKLDVVIKDHFESKDWDDETSPWNSGLDLITLIVKIDVVYTTIVIKTQTSDFCSGIDQALSGTLITICMFVGIIFMVIDFFYAFTEIDNNTKTVIDKQAYGALIPSCILLALSLCAYLLADNEQPLDCGFGCDTFAANQTMNEISCNVEANSGVRFVFMLLATGTVVTLAVIWIIIGLWTKQSEDVIDGTVEGDNDDSEDISLKDM